MTVLFDWSVVTRAAEWWMEAHDTPPKYLLLPAETAEEIVDLAVDIYQVPVRRANVPLPRFDDEIPTTQPWTPIDITRPAVLANFSDLVERAKKGELTDIELQRMSMEEYAAVRHILLPRAQQATEGMSFIEVWKLFTKR